jgi:hypothetical protein
MEKPISKSISKTHPEIAAQAHGWDPTLITSGSGKKLPWRCPVGHVYSAVVSSRTRMGTGCPYCSGRLATPTNNLLVIHPNIAGEWSAKNKSVGPADITPQSGVKRWWICAYGHEWEAAPAARVRGRGCPYCSGRKVGYGNDVATLMPGLLVEFDPLRNPGIDLRQKTVGSETRVTWICIHGHCWEASIEQRARRVTGCPYCAGQRATKSNNLLSKRPDLAAEWHPSRNGSLTPQEIAPKSGVPYWWLCRRGHEWQASPHNRVDSGCPTCSPVGKSKIEIALLAELVVGIQDIQVIGWHELDGPNKKLELDIAIPSHQICIEFDGSYWHRRKESRDRAKNNTLNELGWRPIRLREEPLPCFDSSCISVPRNATPFDLAQIVFERLAKLHPDFEIHAWNYKRNSAPIGQSRAEEILSEVLTRESLMKRAPELAAEWDANENGAIGPEEISVWDDEPRWWICLQGHKWKVSPNARFNSGRGITKCPFCLNKKVGFGNDLASLHPDLVNEWDFVKNTNRNPSSVLPGNSKTKYWWTCEQGHTYQATPYSRVVKRTGCPFCSNNSVSTTNNFNVRFPELAGEWHTTLNGELKPSDIIRRSKLRVWWICGAKHEYERTIGSRLSGSGCPYCAGQSPTPESNFGNQYPELAAEWDTERNIGRLPTDLGPRASGKYWWLCRAGHSYEARISNRKAGTGCPYCAGRKAGYGNDVATRYPHLLKEFDPLLNPGIDLGTKTPGSGKKVTWTCSHGHQWTTTIQYRALMGHNCPICNGTAASEENNFATSFPKLAAEWHPQRNNGLRPTELGFRASGKYWWMCQDGHAYLATITKRKNGSGCPYCSGHKAGYGNDVATRHPHLLADFDPGLNPDVDLAKKTPGSGTKVTWTCTHGHHWTTTIQYRALMGHNCPTCRNLNHRLNGTE